MPHFSATQVNLPAFPFEQEEMCFLYCAQSVLHTHVSLIRVCTKDGYDFCLYQIAQKQQFLFKAEKSTRPIPVGVLQQALRVLAHYCVVTGGNLGEESPYKRSPFLLESTQLLRLSTVHLEIGFGSGVHLLSKAQDQRDQIYVGVEIHTPSIEQVLRHIERFKLQNVYILRADARSLLEILPAQCCLSVDLHFPVPWEKSPTRRVMNANTLAHILRVLVDNGVFWLRTDSLAYFKQSLDLTLALEECACQVAKNAPAPVSSKYEARWIRQNREIYDLRISARHTQAHAPIKNMLLEMERVEGIPRGLDFVLAHRLFRGANYFLHIQDVLEYAQLWVLVLSFGDFNTPTNKIAVWDSQSGALEYVGGLPFNTHANGLAHQKLQEILLEAL
ncbi:tRNA (guanosine(46)-N7)-methyltransferase TrmB [Helicobacter salomonis]|uniref:tRNA (guanosine(46)-N7)-methyltransferase TrmB n=1 Tax=Helicobacter salomonis TaxID=56878 RepID=UPI000CF01732|nr:tRNA (guanosine(46)-N7)-methyltransferase TrmB [Helicobacter salomonis]